jgi:S-adenosylmethionine:tRNA ribosyltransferase-isomerase
VTKAMVLDPNDFDFEVPMRLLARQPREDLGQRRDQSRLLVMRRDSGTTEHVLFRDIDRYLSPGDTLLLNDTKVIPALLHGEREGGGKVDVVIFCRRDDRYWDCTIKPLRGIGPGARLHFDGGKVKATVVDRLQNQTWRVLFDYEGDFFELLNRFGEAATSMYALTCRDPMASYNTVYALKPGATEMPAAGRHFTSELLEGLKAKGVNLGFITLHIGLSSMAVTVENVKNEFLGEEWCSLSPEIADLVNRTKASGHKVMACGTTVTRTLETATGDDGITRPWEGWTHLFIFPGYRWKACDSIITNFHQPKSSRILLAAAFVGWDLVRRAYEEAIVKEYLFYEFGDTTLMM